MIDHTAKNKGQIWKKYSNFTGKEPLKSVTEKEHQACLQRLQVSAKANELGNLQNITVVHKMFK